MWLLIISGVLVVVAFLTTKHLLTRIQIVGATCLFAFMYYKYRNTATLLELLEFLPLPKSFLHLVRMGMQLQSTPSTNSTQKQKRHVTGLQKKIVASEQGWKCKQCNTMLDYSYEVDHITPLYQGGSNDTTNLQALCRNCHGRKTLRDSL
jgi:hypothetical protein